MKKIIIILGLLAIIGGILFFVLKKREKANESKEVNPRRDEISISFRISGEVKPRNRIEIKPQVSGRIEEILVVEGQNVKKGQILAWMSSTERAALLDAVRSNDNDELAKWEDTYKPTPIISPMGGFIIARSKEPGQSVSVNDIILVLADKLIVEANVDETDLRHMKLTQKVSVTLDAFPDKELKGVVEHIAFDSEVISNVTIYKVKIKPLKVPENFRSGMTATVDVVAEKREDALLLPVEAVTGRGEKSFVFIKDEGSDRKRKRVRVETGITDGKNIEIVSGIEESDIVLMPTDKQGKGDGNNGGNRGGNRSGLPFGGRGH